MPAVNVQVRGAVALVCAASAGVHAALVPEHYHEAGWALATAFALSSVALAVCAALSARPDARTGLGRHAQVTVLSAVALCYVLSRTTGIPVLVPIPEEPDALGVVTTTAEVLAAAACVLLRPDRKVAR